MHIAHMINNKHTVQGNYSHEWFDDESLRLTNPKSASKLGKINSLIKNSQDLDNVRIFDVYALFP